VERGMRMENVFLMVVVRFLMSAVV